MNRRDTLRLASGSLIAAVPRAGSAEAAAVPRTGIYARLLDAWTRALVGLQVRSPAVPSIAGGIACPACARLHGRAVDAVYPLLAQARRTGDRRFLDAAVRLFRWADVATGRPDGSFDNEPTSSGWRGTTVFATISLSEALHRHGALLDRRERVFWRERLARAAAFLDRFFTDSRPAVINYPLSVPAALALAGRALEDDALAKRARERARDVSQWFTPEARLLFGEAHPTRIRSARGRYPVDLLYNVEESLPNLVLYARASGDDELLELVTDSLRRHLAFMLPDGAWDGGWGTRSFKWAYWGSRTTDGCQTAYGLLADRDPAFAEAARRNAELLAACTHDGLVHGGPHLRTLGEPPCVHHTFCRAKAMAWMVDERVPEPRSRVPLPRETAAGVTRYPEIGTDLAAHGPWRATLTTYDARYAGPGGHPSGGALTMLWHERLGPVFTASLSRYDAGREPNNMPPHRASEHAPCLTPRVRGTDDRWASIHDEDASVDWSTSANVIEATVMARVCTLERSDARGPRVRLRHRLSQEECVIAAELLDPPTDPVALVLPVVVSSEHDARTDGETSFVVTTPKGRLVVQASRPLRVGATEQAGRIFQHVPGFQAVPLEIPLALGVAAEVRLRVE